MYVWRDLQITGIPRAPRLDREARAMALNQMEIHTSIVIGKHVLRGGEEKKREDKEPQQVNSSYASHQHLLPTTMMGNQLDKLSLTQILPLDP